MATKFSEIEEYITTKWYNYNPPSIDQINLLHIEDNIKLNRDTINEIIRRLGAVPESGNSSENQNIYDSSIYDTLISHKDLIKKLQNDKLDKTTYNSGKADLQAQIDNRLRKDQDDVSSYGYTFKKLALTETLSVGTTSTFTGAVTAKSTLTVSGKLSANGGLETTTLKATGATTLTNTLNVSGATSMSGGLTVTKGGNITGTLTVDNLVVTGGISVSGAGSFGGNVTCKNLTASSGVTGNTVTTKQNYITLGASGEHILYVQGSNASLRGGDALIKTVS